MVLNNNYFSFTILFYLFFNSILIAQEQKINNNTDLSDENFRKDQIRVKFTTHFAIKCLEKNINIKKAFKEINPDWTFSLQRAFPNISLSGKSKRYKAGLAAPALIYNITIPQNIKIKRFINIMQQKPQIEYAETINNQYQPLHTPNDPLSDSSRFHYYPDSLVAWQLENANVFKAWDISKGDSNITIALTDVGYNIDHEDFKNSIAYNENDTIDGIDNDNDGYVDNYHGWDLSEGDNDVSSSQGHGMHVAGTIGATPDNNTGLTGTGYNCKILPLKVFGDNNFQGYQGIIYAVNHGADVIVLSWGAPNSYSNSVRDLINWAVMEKDVVIVAAAGNESKEVKYYPASYQNVLSVTHSDYNDCLGPKSTYNSAVDVMAPGVQTLSFTGGNDYRYVDGSSFSAPLVGGLAGLLKSHRKNLMVKQIQELIRVTANTSVDTIKQACNTDGGNPAYDDKYGRGLVDFKKALIDTLSPSVKMFDFKTNNKILDGDTGKITGKYVNYLNESPGLNITLTSSSPYVDIIDSAITFNDTLSMMDSLQQKKPFSFKINSSIPVNQKVKFKLVFKDSTFNDFEYTDYQYFSVTLNPSFINLDTNNIIFTLNSNGRQGYNDINLKEGDGLLYKGKNLLAEGGLLIGKDTNHVSDVIRGDTTKRNNDFNTISYIEYQNKNNIKGQYTNTIYADTSIKNSIGVKVKQEAYAFDKKDMKNFVIIEYNITNLTNNKIDSLYTGIFNDFDIIDFDANQAKWDTNAKMGYVFNKQGDSIYAGIKLLSPQKQNFYAFNNNGGGNSISINDGFSVQEKYKTLSGELKSDSAGNVISGKDVSIMLSAMVDSLLPLQTNKVAFALIVSDKGMKDFRSSAYTAKETYYDLHTGPIPDTLRYLYCNTDTVFDFSLEPVPGSQFNLYNSNRVSKLKNKTDFHLDTIYLKDTFYVSNTEKYYESKKSPVFFSNYDFNADFTYDSSKTYKGNTFKLKQKSDSLAINYHWNFGNGDTSNLSEPQISYEVADTFNVKLRIKDTLGCKDSVDKNIIINTVTTFNKNRNNRDIIIYPNPAKEYIQIKSNNFPLRGKQLIIRDAKGKVILNKKLKNYKKINLNNLSSGIYNIRILNNERVLFSENFIK